MRSDIAIVIGNGESRKHINLQNLTGNITMIGCNAVHRDAIVDYLVCCDYRMVDEAVRNINNCQTLIYTRQEHISKFPNHKNVVRVPEIPYPQIQRIDYDRNWGSGPYAILIAGNLNFNQYYLLGFDLYGNGNCVNNIYKDTKNYAGSQSHSIDPSYWIYQTAKLFTIFNQKNFFIVNESQWKIPEQWNLPNVSFLDIDSFDTTCINNKYPL